MKSRSTYTQSVTDYVLSLIHIYTSKAFAILMSAMMAVGIAMPVSAAEKKETKVDKSETVYVNANADGSVDKITVSDLSLIHIYNLQWAFSSGTVAGRAIVKRNQELFKDNRHTMEENDGISERNRRR